MVRNNSPTLSLLDQGAVGVVMALGLATGDVMDPAAAGRSPQPKTPIPLTIPINQIPIKAIPIKAILISQIPINKIPMFLLQVPTFHLHHHLHHFQLLILMLLQFQILTCQSFQPPRQMFLLKSRLSRPATLVMAAPLVL